jgi:hypothetical protein
MTKAVTVRTDGSTTVIDLETDSLSKLQEAVGGYIQPVDISDTLTLWVNEEGKLMSLPHNPTAQRYYDKRWGAGRDFIVGNVVFTGGVGPDGETLGLTDEQVSAIVFVNA